MRKRAGETKKKGFICSRCGGMVESERPVKIAFFISDHGDLTEEGLPEDMARSIEENFCGVCAVKIRQAMMPQAEISVPMLKSLEPGYVKPARPAKKTARGKNVTMEKAAENLRRISEMYNRGEHVGDIAKAIGVGVPVIKRHIRELIEAGELEERKPEKKEPEKKPEKKAPGRKASGKRISAEGEQEIYEMYLGGDAYDEIAEIFGVSNQTIAYHVNKLNRRRQKSGP